MKLLLDTHVLLWAAGLPERLPEDARALIEAPGTDPVFSAASLWEVAIKNGLGRADSTWATNMPERRRPDPESGERYTVKRYESERVDDGFRGDSAGTRQLLQTIEPASEMRAFVPHRSEPDFQRSKSAQQRLLVSADQAFHTLGRSCLW